MKKFKTRIMAMAAAVIVAGLLGGVTSAAAQDAALGKSVWINKVNCRDCHGWGGHGAPDDPQAPRGPNLRETALNVDDLVEVMQCGRIGTPMPFFRRSSWAAGDTRCYGITAADLGDDVPGRGIVTLSTREMTAIAILITEQFVGKGSPTFEECIEFWGEGASTCGQYPRAE